MDHSDLRERVRQANLGLFRRGLVLLNFGNVSEVDRAAGIVAIKPSGMPYEGLTPADIVLVSLASGEVVAGDARPSSDTPTHLALYRGFGSIGAVAHTHSRHATAWAQAARELPCRGTTHADYFRGTVPVTRPLTAAEVEAEYEANTGRVIVERFASGDPNSADVPAVLVAYHGPFVWAATADDAVTTAEVLEEIAATALLSELLQPDLEPIDTSLILRHHDRKHGPTAYYGQPRATPGR